MEAIVFGDGRAELKTSLRAQPGAGFVGAA
jgi:hypothetical protein